MGETRVGGELFQKQKQNTKKQWKNNNNNKNNEEAEDSQKSLAVSGRGVKECAMFDLSLFCFSFCLSRRTMTTIISMTVIFNDHVGKKIQCCQFDLSLKEKKKTKKKK